MNRLIGKSGPFVVIIIALIPALLWLPTASTTNQVTVLIGISRVMALVGTTLFCLNFILATRWKPLEALFTGLNRVYLTHHLVGTFGFILLVLHPLFAILSYLLISPESALRLITPTAKNYPLVSGMIALLLLIVLLFLTLYRKLEYDTWKKTHQLLGIPLFFAIAHSYFIGSTLATNPILKAYLFIFFAAGVISYLSRMVTKRSRLFKYRYTVNSIEVDQKTTLLYLKPVDRQIKFIPGQFAFIEINHIKINKESHPFSFTNSPDDPVLSFAIKSVGGYTESLKSLTEGSEVMIEGPYGRFSYQHCQNKKQLWIGGGIGITPFTSMIKSVPSGKDYSIYLYYCIRDHSEKAILTALLNKLPSDNPVRIITWTSHNQGRLTANKISTVISDLIHREIFICGPSAMMSSLKKQLKLFGVSSDHIHTEEFVLA